MDLHDIANQVARTSGADFAFVLSQAGLLVTRDAPHNMPDSGRMKILWACPRGNSDIVHMELPREQLVPFGGAAPVDVFAVRVEDTAILVAVMASWNDKANVMLALAAGAASLGEMIRKAKRLRAQKNGAAKKQGEGARRDRASTLPGESPRKERTSALPAESPRKERKSLLPAEPARRERSSKLPPEPARRDRTSSLPAEPARRDRTSALPKAPKEAAAKAIRFVPSDSPEAVARARSEAQGSAREAAGAKRRPGDGRARGSSEPEIVVGEAEVGRETMFAIEVELQRPSSPGREPASSKRRPGDGRARGSSEPEIQVGEAAVGRETLVAIETDLHRPAGPTPEAVRVTLASIGRETMAEIARADAEEMARSPTVEEPLVVLERRTLPWVDPSAIKRAVDAKAKARAVAPPDVKVTIEELDPDALERALREDDKR